MRTNLNVKFEENQKVKSLGAKWDCARKVWYIENVENIEQFLPWIPTHLKKPSKAINLKKQLKASEVKIKKDD